MKLLENAIDLLLAVLDLLILHQVQLLQLQESLEDDSYLLLDDLGEGRLIVHHQRDDPHEAAEGLTGRELGHEAVQSEGLLLLL